MRERKKIAHTAFTNHSRFSILILRSLRHAAGGRAEGAGVVIVMSTDIITTQNRRSNVLSITPRECTSVCYLVRALSATMAEA